MVRILILGTRGNVPASAPRYARHSGVLVDGRILIDVGEPGYLRHRPSHVFITHLHPDHAAVSEQQVPEGTTVYVPEPTPAFPRARVVRRAVSLGPYRIAPVPTVHSARVRSVGYVVEKEGRRVFYSSDLVEIELRHHRKLRRLDLVLTDGSYLRRGGLVRVDPATGVRFGHAGVPDLVEFFRRFTRRIVITHFGSWFYRDVAAARRRIAAMSEGDLVVRAAYDGMSVEV